MFRGKHKDAGGVFQPLKSMLGFTWAYMARLLRVNSFHPKAVDFICNIVKSKIDDRRKTGRSKNDFISTGVHTTSTMTLVMFWYLAQNPDVQESLYQKILQAIETNRDSQHLDYETIQNLPYLDGMTH